MNDMTAFFGEPISIYTRKNGIDDGLLIDVSETAREAGIKFPVAITREAWNDCVAWTDEDTRRKRVPNDEAGRLWDVLNMMALVIRSKTDRSHVLEVPLTDGVHVARINSADAHKIHGKAWHFDRGYAVHTTKVGGVSKSIYMHRLVAEAPAYFNVDHRDGDGLNNCRANLRLATQSQNNANAAVRSDNRSGFRGVSWESQTEKWRARLLFDGRDMSLGRFKTIEEAAQAYANAANEVMGEFALQNREKGDSQINFRLLRVPREGKGQKPRLVTLKAICGPGDDGEPVITIMMPSED